MEQTADPLGPTVDDTGHREHDLYPVTGGDLDDTRLPRRPAAGSKGVLLVDDDEGFVHFLDADDQAKTFVYRQSRPMRGEITDTDYPRDGSDHVVRAAYEHEWDVITMPETPADPAPRAQGGRR